MTASMRKIIHSDQAPAAIGPYSQAVLQAGWLFCSGQIGLDPKSGELVTGGSPAVLDASGLSFADVVKTTMYLVDLQDFSVVNEIYAEAFGEHAPARATVEVSALPRAARVEIECIAKSRDQNPSP